MKQTWIYGVLRTLKRRLQAYQCDIYYVWHEIAFALFPEYVRHRFLNAHSETNQLSFQRTHWGEFFQKHSHQEIESISRAGWGDPAGDKSVLGDYRELVKNELLPYVNGSRVLDLGCLNGKYLQYFEGASHVTAVDLNPTSFEYIKSVYKPNESRMSFYLTKGNELDGIPSGSIDFLWSIDTLTRAPKAVIRDYFKEFARVLSPKGRLCVHLPCNSSCQSVMRNFTDISASEIREYAQDARLLNWDISTKYLRHGVLLKAYSL